MRWNRNVRVGALAVMVGVMLGCGGGGDGSSSSAPGAVSMVASGGFTRPLDAVSTHDGRVFYFTGFTEDAERRAAVFRVAAAGGSAEAVHTGAPLAFPTGLVMSCDDSTLYVADMRSESDDPEAIIGDAGGLYAIATATGALSPLTATGIAVPTGLALSVDCTTLYVTGWTEAGSPALFTLPIAGGAATVVHEGAPLVSVTGVHVDADNTAWVMDHLAAGDNGTGMLFAIRPDGSVSPVVSGLRLGAPGGVSLTSAGDTAVIPTLNDDGEAELLAVVIESGVMTHIATPTIEDPAGLRTARNAPVFAVVDSEGGSILRAE